ncbi:biotin--[acetyl-CoA-carboxylase] ligase [Brevibacillus fulvus]|uniref:Bifunctional ligase/repressor BirA n=1 Tax=Brevibacillus fulvus TaxID=1125967 RepID=A0A938XVJ4_9BACL|nr:biotin--[acetyl-CoA-carboxylase] ligase [Brevibacillus fulvus]MBM7588746.1 BirA family biotin operon repressor/biotin-[acetyl-CoA-carboxylase] ligase [Brevibacillus fulvus]
MHIKQKILKEFHANPDQFVSGEYLSQACHCTRTAVWKHIEELRKDGYRIEAVRKSGYRLLGAPDAVTAAEITAGLSTELIGQTVIAYDSVASTQPLAHEAAGKGTPEGTLVIADQQTGGKGRLGRKWHSPQGTGIWMSLIIRPNIPLPKAPQLTLLTAVAMARAIEEQTSLPVQIKWPNDLLIGGKKVCGILTEMHAESDRIHYLVIGMGVNVNVTSDDFPEDLRQIATSLRMETGRVLRRASLIQAFCRHFEFYYLDYLQHGFARVRQEWEQKSYSLGRVVTVRTLHHTIEGKALGLDQEGVLLVVDREGRQHKVYSADIDYGEN